MLIRVLTLHFLQFNIFFQDRHVPGVDYSIADALSHQQMDGFRVLAPGAWFQLDVLPDEVWNLGGQRLIEP